MLKGVGKRIIFFCLFLQVIGGMISQDVLASDKPLSERHLWRFEFDNDAVGGSDDMFTNGMYLQRHTPAGKSWDDMNLYSFERWIVSILPGLAGGDGVWVKQGLGIGHAMMTPENLETSEFIENDVPYSATLGVASSWYTVNDDRMAGFQIYLGMLGPAACGREVQRFAHVDMGFGEDPLGWRNQLDNEFLINLNYGYAHKLLRWGDFESRKGFCVDFSGFGHACVGNYFTAADIGLQLRCGWGLPRGFTNVPNPIGRGIMLNPTPDVPTGHWDFYLSLTPRGTVTGYTVLFDGNTFEDSPSINYENYAGFLIIGLHLSKGAFTMRYNFTLATTPTDTGTNTDKTDLSWGNLTLEYLF